MRTTLKSNFGHSWNSMVFEVKVSSQDCLKGESWGFFKVEIPIRNSCGSKLWLQITLNLQEMVGTQRYWYLKWCPNPALFIDKEIRFLRYISMKISKQNWETLKETLENVLWWIFAYCCRSEDSSTFTVDFETKYFCKK